MQTHRFDIPAHRPAFTLVELLVVISIVILLVGLTLTVGVAVVTRAEVRRTETTLVLLNTALESWSFASERQVTYGTPGNPQASYDYDIDETVFEVDELTIPLLTIIGRNPDAQTVLAQMSTKAVVKTDDVPPVTFVQDAWDGPIAVIFPGRAWVQGDPSADDDGTIRTVYEDLLGVAVNRRICFVSAGPDGEFGDRSATTGTEDFEATLDNLYSYELEAPP